MPFKKTLVLIGVLLAAGVLYASRGRIEARYEVRQSTITTEVVMTKTTYKAAESRTRPVMVGDVLMAQARIYPAEYETSFSDKTGKTFRIFTKEAHEQFRGHEGRPAIITYQQKTCTSYSWTGTVLSQVVCSVDIQRAELK